jgi:hypothetical protein
MFGKIFTPILFVIFIYWMLGCNEDKNTQLYQFPSPMAENTRAHERIEDKIYPGSTFTINNVFEKSFKLFVPEKFKTADSANLLIHFHGADYVTEFAASKSEIPFAAATIYIGSGSSVYEKPFNDEKLFPKILRTINECLIDSLNINIEKVYISSFSAGYGAVRALLKQDFAISKIEGVLLLDGWHTDYIPDRKLLAEGGKLNTEKLEPFVKFAQLALDNKKSFIITHSEIFPGTYASTTETADYLIQQLILKRQAVLKKGPLGMQQLSEVKNSRLLVLGFAGNSARDHIDHLHALFKFIIYFSSYMGTDKSEM